jgi:hypothetical protein
MTDLEQAIAAFAAQNTVTVCPAITSAKAAREVPRYTEKQSNADKDAYERSERNAENKRYDNEGVYYIGGKMVETKYGF